MYAIIKTGGKQYRVTPGDVIYVEKLEAEDNATVDFDALLVSGDSIRVGAPVVEGVKVQALVLGQGKGQKITIYKYKAKKNQRRKQGHRQPYTKLEIVAIQG